MVSEELFGCSALVADTVVYKTQEEPHGGTPSQSHQGGGKPNIFPLHSLTLCMTPVEQHVSCGTPCPPGFLENRTAT